MVMRHRRVEHDDACAGNVMRAHAAHESVAEHGHKVLGAALVLVVAAQDDVVDFAEHLERALRLGDVAMLGEVALHDDQLRTPCPRFGDGRAQASHRRRLDARSRPQRIMHRRQEGEVLEPDVHVADGREPEELLTRRRREPDSIDLARDHRPADPLDDLSGADVDREGR